MRRRAGLRDSATAKTITHEYDLPVLAERIRSLSRWRSAAGSAPAPALYGSVRGGATPGERAAPPAPMNVAFYWIFPVQSHIH